MHYLDERMGDRLTDDGLLQRTLWAMPSSQEVAAMTRLLSILHFSIVVPMRYLAGKTHEFAEYEWGPINMSKCFDDMHDWLTEISGDPTKVLDEDFMLGWFDDYKQQLEPFREYCDSVYGDEEEREPIRSKATHALVASLRDICDEAFHPENMALQECQARMLELVPRVVNGILEELEDKSKVTWLHLSKFGEEHKAKDGYSLSWEHRYVRVALEMTVMFANSFVSTDKMKEDFMGRRTSNAITESALGGNTQILHTHGKINITNAAAVSDAQRNEVLGYRRKTNDDGRVVWEAGFLNNQEDWLSEAMMESVREQANAQKIENRELLEAYQKRRAEVRAKRQKELEVKAEKDLIRAYDYCKLYYDSEHCMKDVGKVDEWLESLPTKTKKMEMVKENFRMREFGLGLTQFHQVREYVISP